jgi:hypothetical protein
MSVSAKIRDLISDYSAGSMDVSQFRDRFLPLLATSNVCDKDGINLAFNVESIYAEYVAQIIDEKELRSRLTHLAPLEKNSYVFGFGATSGNDASELRSVIGSSALAASV